MLNNYIMFSNNNRLKNRDFNIDHNNRDYDFPMIEQPYRGGQLLTRASPRSPS
jgi:hypothetical protein